VTTEINIALIPGDGIGTEVMPEGVRVLEAAGKKHGLQFQISEFDWSCLYRHRCHRSLGQPEPKWRPPVNV
jgi:tartrate dehydrogenase/decarboxylase/D-malate dehydrogenase